MGVEGTAYRLDAQGQVLPLPTKPVFAFRLFFSAMLLCAAAAVARAQDNYEIQVYGSETVPPGYTMLELHSNFTVEGSKQIEDGVLPTNHAWHETVEITHGFNSWFETGFYIFTSARSGSGELRPIIDKQLGRWYLSFNPTIERALKGADTKRGFEFSPNAKVSYDITERVTGGLEYYGALGPVTGFDPFREQQHQFIPSIDLNVSPKWEFNFGVGVGVTSNTDHLIIKMIVGRRLRLGRKR